MNKSLTRWLELVQLPKGVLVLALVGLLLAGGCATSRPEYFRDLECRRLRAYERWEAQSLDDKRPRIVGELSLAEAVRLALEYNTELQAALEDREMARGRVYEAYSEALPQVDLSADYIRLDEVFTIDLGVNTFQVGDVDNYSYRVKVTQPLYKGGNMFIAQQVARLFSYLTDEGVRQAVENVIFSAANTYYDAVLAESLIQVQEAALESARAQLDAVKARQRQGVATEFDVLRARVEVSIIEADLIEQRNRRNLGRAELLKRIGVSQQSEVELITNLSYQPGQPGFEEALRLAFLNRPDISQAVIGLDLQDKALRVAYSDYLPHLEAYYWNLWARPDPHEASTIEWGSQWQAGLTLTWPLFDGLAREGRIMREKALLRQKEILLSEAEEQAVLEVRSALLELENAQEFAASQSQNVTRARRALELAEAGYRAEVNTELEVLDARTAVTRAEGLHYGALHRHTIARMVLQKAMGLLGPKPGTQEVPKDVKPPGDMGEILLQLQKGADETLDAP